MSARFLGYSRAALGLVLLVRTTPLSRVLPWPVSHVVAHLLGWPEHGFRAAWGGLALPDGVVIALCTLRTVAAVLFTLGMWTRAAGTVAAVAALFVLSQDAFGFKFTLYTLFVGTLLLGVSGGGCRFALRPSPPGIGPSPWLVRAFVASVYAWSAIAKLRGSWLSGETLRMLYQAHYLTGELADALFSSLAGCRASAWGVVVAELLLGPMLLFRRTRLAGLMLAVGMHLAYEWTARPDVFGWVMAALLVSFVGSITPRNHASSSAGAVASSQPCSKRAASAPSRRWCSMRSRAAADPAAPLMRRGVLPK